MNVDERRAYRQTAKWRRISAGCIAAAMGFCEVCHGQATESHHLDLADYGHEEELPYCLVAMCHSCHVRAHPGMAERESRVISRDVTREFRRDVTT